MIRSQSGSLCADAKSIIEQFRNLTDKDVEALEERKSILLNALNNFNKRLESLPSWDRDALISLFYREMRDTLFSFQILLEMIRTHEKNAPTGEQNQEILHELQKNIQGIATF